MQITMNNRNNQEYEKMMDDLIQNVFGFSFGPWFERELWDERYESYSVIENGVMLANVCIFKTDMIVSGSAMRAHQFGAVATRKSERGRGLSRLLLEYVLGKYPDTPAYLAANPSVTDFYPKLGFRQIQTYRPQIAVEINNTAIPVKLSPDAETVAEMLTLRGAYSKVLDALNAGAIQVFHMILEYEDSIYELSECGALVVAEQEGRRLFIADVISRTPLSFADICRELPFSGVSSVEFGFCPDWLGIACEWVPADMEEQPYFVHGTWNLPTKFRFPAMSET